MADAVKIIFQNRIANLVSNEILFLPQKIADIITDIKAKAPVPGRYVGAGISNIDKVELIRKINWYAHIQLVVRHKANAGVKSFSILL